MINTFKQSLLFLATLLIGGAGVAIMLGTLANASTDYGNYQYEVITSSQASTTPLTVFTVHGTLGNVIIGSQSSSTASTAISIYDNDNGTSTATLIGTIEAGASEGTYQFDVALTDGITIEVPPAFDGVYTITYRQ